MTDKDATVIIFDIGKNSAHKNKEQISFFDQAKKCIEKILQRKILSQPKDEVGLILMGTNETFNQLNNTLGGYECISEAFKMSITNWQMMRIIEKEIEPNNGDADWLDAIVVAMDYLKSEIVAKKFKALRIVLLTTFLSKVDGGNAYVVMQALRNMEVELIVITNNVEYVRDPNKTDENEEEAIFSQVEGRTKEQTESESLIYEIIANTNGVLCSFDQALMQLIYFEKKKQRSMPWNCPLEIGSNLKINISALIQIKEVTSLASFKTTGPDGPCKLSTEYYVDDKELEKEKIEELIRGYMYGTTPVAYDSSLGMSFDSGGKCLKCLGFTDQKYVGEEKFAGTGVWTIVAQNGYKVSEQMFVALVNAMRTTNMALIARYVYRNGTKVKIMALFPYDMSDSNIMDYKRTASLAMVEIYFADNHIFMDFPSLQTKKNEPTEEQYNVVDQLIDSMNLMEASDGDGISYEAFAHKKILNPTVQYTYRTIAHRALHPTQPVPVPEQDLLDLLDAPKSLKKVAARHLANVKELFPLTNIVKPGKDLLFQKLQQISSTPTGISDSSDILLQPSLVADKTLLEIGTVTPAEDFAALLQRGEKFATLCIQIQNVIADLLFKTVINQETKITMAILLYREEAKLIGAYRYNEWINEFKITVLNRNKLEFWEKVIVQNRFGLISAKESEMSTVTDEEVEGFYAVFLNEASNTVDNAEDADVDDLLDNM